MDCTCTGLCWCLGCSGAPRRHDSADSTDCMMTCPHTAELAGSESLLSNDLPQLQQQLQQEQPQQPHQQQQHEQQQQQQKPLQRDNQHQVSDIRPLLSPDNKPRKIAVVKPTARVEPRPKAPARSVGAGARAATQLSPAAQAVMPTQSGGGRGAAVFVVNQTINGGVHPVLSGNAVVNTAGQSTVENSRVAGSINHSMVASSRVVPVRQESAYADNSLMPLDLQSTCAVVSNAGETVARTGQAQVVMQLSEHTCTRTFEPLPVGKPEIHRLQVLPLSSNVALEHNLHKSGSRTSFLTFSDSSDNEKESIETTQKGLSDTSFGLSPEPELCVDWGECLNRQPSSGDEAACGGTPWDDVLLQGGQYDVFVDRGHDNFGLQLESRLGEHSVEGVGRVLEQGERIERGDNILGGQFLQVESRVPDEGVLHRHGLSGGDCEVGTDQDFTTPQIDTRGAVTQDQIPARTETSVERQKRSELLCDCKYYYGSMTNGEAKALLRHSPVGTFVLRDSSDPNFLYSLSVRTPRGTTSIRIAPCKGCPLVSPPFEGGAPGVVCANCRRARRALQGESRPTAVSSSLGGTVLLNMSPTNSLNLSAPPSTPAGNTLTTQGSRSPPMARTPPILRAPRMMRLDCEPHQEATMPHFADVLALVEYCRQGAEGGQGGAAAPHRCMFLEQSGRMDTPVLLIHPLCRPAA